MNKRKHSQRIPGEFLLKLHLIIYVICMVLLGLSLLATFNYSGNAAGDFAVFRPFIEDRITVTILWGMIVLGHVGGQQIRAVLYNRAQRHHLNAVYTGDHERLLNVYDTESDDVFYDDAPETKRAKS